MSRMADDGMCCVVMGQAEHQAGFLDQLHQLLGFLQRVRHGLVTHDVKASLQTYLGHRKMRNVRRHDTHKIDSLVLP